MILQRLSEKETSETTLLEQEQEQKLGKTADKYEIKRKGELYGRYDFYAGRRSCGRIGRFKVLCL